MPHNPIRVVVGPANYFSHPGSFNHLHDFFTDEQLSRAVWIYGKRAIAAAQTKLPPAFGLPGAKHILFRGHCSESDVQQLAAESGDDRSVVIGVGGGALLDTAKALARRLGLPFVAAPTIAATCAAWTPLSVWYDDVLAQLTGAYQRFHLPTTLAELEVDINNHAEIDKVITHTLRPVESIHYLPVTLTPDTLRAAFEKVESFKA
ncbi:iron-containing alcohol dehydrogenase [Escherichia coli]|nr:iron-containing alcohol dehydrogenase [Escherichia coli]